MLTYKLYFYRHLGIQHLHPAEAKRHTPSSWALHKDRDESAAIMASAQRLPRLRIAGAAALLLLGAFSLASAMDVSASSAGKCLDNSGAPVAWWFMYKMPDGYTFAYIDANDARTAGTLKLYPYELNDDAHPSALINTLRSLVAQENGGVQSSAAAAMTALNSSSAPAGTTPFFMYNDQPDNGTPGSDFGHTKGVVAVGPSTSFWLLHSTPNFPSSSGLPKFYFPQAEIKFGQTFLCSTIESAQVEVIAQQLLYTRPFIYMSKGVDATLLGKCVLTACRHQPLFLVLLRRFLTFIIFPGLFTQQPGLSSLATVYHHIQRDEK